MGKRVIGRGTIGIKTAFVTGATGFLGRNLVEILIDHGWKVTALVRDQAKAETLLPTGLEYIIGDIADHRWQSELADHYHCCFHTAADTSTWSRDKERQWQTNVTGTQAVLSGMKGRADRIVYVSTIAVFGVQPGTITEESPHLGAGSPIGYVASKTEAENRVKRACSQGMDIVTVNPTHIAGRYDDHNWARLIKMVWDGSLPGIPPGGGNFASGQAVAEALLAAYEKGKSGENYILGGPFITFDDFVQQAALTLGVPVKAKRTPPWALKLLSTILDLTSPLRQTKPMMTRDDAYFACDTIDACSGLAEEVLDYKPWPTKNIIQDAADYLRSRNQESTLK